MKPVFAQVHLDDNKQPVLVALEPYCTVKPSGSSLYWDKTSEQYVECLLLFDFCFALNIFNYS